jgi:hypothetical protein
MVYVVERYLPGLYRSELLQGLARLERSPEVRYLGSTIVLQDEACFCQFEGPSEAAVAEANRRAGLTFDRIVPAVTVEPTERRGQMTVSSSIPATVQIRRSSLLGGAVLVAAAAAAVTWVLLTFAWGTSSSTAGTAGGQSSVQQIESYGRGLTNAGAFFRTPAQEARYVQGIVSMSRVEQAAAFGGHNGVIEALGLDPQDARYVEEIMALTPAQLSAGFGTGGR